MSLPETPRRPEDFEDKVENLKFMKKRVPMGYISTVISLKGMMKGEDPEGVRDEYYPGWENSDFEDLLKELGEWEGSKK